MTIKNVLKTSLPLFLFFSQFLVSAQAPEILWDKTIGGSQNDYATSVVATEDGGMVICGFSNSNASGDKTESGFNYYSYQNDFWVVKLNAQGQKIWDNTIGGDDDDVAYGIVTTADDGFLVVGYSTSGLSGDKSEFSKGYSDMWIIKIDSFGNKVWDKTIGGNKADIAYSAAEMTDGSFIISGVSFSDTSGDKSENKKGLHDYWIVKLNSSGQKLWDKTIGGNSVDRAYAIKATLDGGFILSGNSESAASGDKSEDSRGQDDYWIIKMDSEGEKEWDRTFGGTSLDNSKTIALTNDGGYIVAGSSLSDASGDKSEDQNGSGNQGDYWILKLNSQGIKEWDKTIGGNGSESFYSAISTGDGGSIIFGSSISNISADKTEPVKGYSDYWVVKINSLGNILWDKTIGGISYDISSYPNGGCVISKDGSLILAGSAKANASGDKTENSKGGWDYWIVKLEPENNQPDISLSSDFKFGGGISTLEKNKSYLVSGEIQNTSETLWSGDIYMKVGTSSYQLYKSNINLASGDTLQLYNSYTFSTLGQTIPVELFGKKAGTTEFFSMGTTNNTQNPIYVNVVEQRLEPVIGIPFIRLNKTEINPGESVQIIGGSFEPNSTVSVRSEPEIPTATYSSYTTGTDGSLHATFTVPISFEERYLNIVVLDTTKTYPKSVLVVNQPNEIAELRLSSPDKENQTFAIPPNGTIPLEVTDKLLLNSNYTSSGASRSYSYEIGFQLAGESTVHALYQINGYGLINSNLNEFVQIPMSNSLFSNITEGNGISLKFVVTDLFDNSRVSESPLVFVKVGQRLIKVSQKWDKSLSLNPSKDPVGLAADGVSRIYLMVEKEKSSGSPIQSVSINLASDLSDQYPNEYKKGQHLGRLKYATTQNNNFYDQEANNINSLVAQNNSLNSNGQYWFWYLSPDDFTQNGLPVNYNNDSKRERTVLANITVTFADNSTEALTHEIKIVRPPLMMVHGWIGSPSSFNVMAKDTRMIQTQTLVHNNRMHPYSTFDFNSNILLNKYPEYSKSSFESVLNEMRFNHLIASNQVDYIAHSMGGLMLRNILSKRANSVLKNDFFQSDAKIYNFKNYSKGWVHKYITINTPHFGTPGADIMAGMIPLVGERIESLMLENLGIFKPLPGFIKRENGILTAEYLNGNITLTPSDAVLNMQTNVSAGGRTNFKNVEIKSHVIITDVNLGTNTSSSTFNFHKDLFDEFQIDLGISFNSYTKIFNNYLFPLVRSLSTVNVDLNSKKSLVSDFILHNREEINDIWNTSNYELGVDNIDNSYAVGLNPKLLYALSRTFETFGTFNQKYSDFLWNGDLVVPNHSQASGLPLNAPNLSLLANSQETDLKSFHLDIQKEEKTISRVFKLLNSSIHSDLFGDLPENTNSETRISTNTLQADQPTMQKKSVAELSSINTLEQWDSSKIIITSPSRMSEINQSSVFEIEINVADTVSLKKVELQLGGTVINSWNKSKNYTFLYNSQDLLPGVHRIYATAFYDISGQEYLKYDTLSVDIIFDKVASKLTVFPEVKTINIEESFFPNYELQYGNQISGFIELNQLNVNISNHSCLHYNVETGYFEGLRKGESVVTFDYNGILKDTMYVAVGGGGTPYAQTIQTNTLDNTFACAGETIQIPFTTAGGSFDEGNQFLAQISNKDGENFHLLETTGNSSPLFVKIPNDLESTSGYLIRVVSTNVPVIGTNSPTSLTITAFESAPSVSTDKIEFRDGENVTLTASGCSDEVKWSDGQIGNQITISPTESVVYYAVCTDQICESVNSEPIIIGKYLCVSNLEPEGNIDSGTFTREAGVQIISTEKISGDSTNIQYQAPATLLNPGFEVNSGAVFNVIIGGCN